MSIRNLPGLHFIRPWRISRRFCAVSSQSACARGRGRARWPVL